MFSSAELSGAMVSFLGGVSRVLIYYSMSTN
jgi:hypothetical protein